MATKRPSKKKTAAKKAAAARPKKKAPAKKATPAKPKAKAKAKPAAKPVKKAAPKKATPKAKPVSVKDLLKKKFDVDAPKTPYSVPKDKIETSKLTAPDLLSAFADKDAKRIRELLANTYTASDLKAAAEKAAAEKAAAEKAAAEKAAAEKAAAEKAAAEKAAAEKAAAEKAAAEKAAAEKAAAEKAAAEKAAAEKAAAEKAAAEKAEEIKKAAAHKSEVSVTYDTAPAKPIAKPASDPVDNTIKIFAAGLAFLILLVIGASISNSSKFYLEGNEGVLEIWKGKFAPLGKQMVIALPGVPLPASTKDVYAKTDVYPMAFQFYLDKADALLQAPGIPDFEGIKSELKNALAYGSNKELRALAYDRIDNIDRLILVHKADVFASRGTIEDLESAIDYLKDAEKLTRDDAQAAMIDQKIERLKAGITALEEQAAAEAAAVQAETEAEAAVAESEAETEEAPESAATVETESEDDEAPAANDAEAAHDTDHS